MAELDGGDVAKIHFPSKSDLTRFNVDVTPDSGFWTGATYHFTFTVPPAYPHEAPKVDGCLPAWLAGCPCPFHPGAMAL